MNNNGINKQLQTTAEKQRSLWAEHAFNTLHFINCWWSILK